MLTKVINTIGCMKTDATNTYVRKVLGVTVGRLRLEQGLSQSRLADMVDLDRSRINQFEGGKENVSLDYLVKIADGLDVPISDFFVGLSDASPHELAARNNGSMETRL